MTQLADDLDSATAYERATPNPIDPLVLAMRACEPQALALLDQREPIPPDVAERIRDATQTLTELVSVLDQTNLELRRRKYQPTSLHELVHRHESPA